MTLLSQLVRAPCVTCHHDTLIVAGQCQECQTVQPYAVGLWQAPRPTRVGQSMIEAWRKARDKRKRVRTPELRAAENERQRRRRARQRAQQVGA
jgi:hypothetical protein